MTVLFNSTYSKGHTLTSFWRWWVNCCSMYVRTCMYVHSYVYTYVRIPTYVCMYAVCMWCMLFSHPQLMQVFCSKSIQMWHLPFCAIIRTYERVICYIFPSIIMHVYSTMYVRTYLNKASVVPLLCPSPSQVSQWYDLVVFTASLEVSVFLLGSLTGSVLRCL